MLEVESENEINFFPFNPEPNVQSPDFPSLEAGIISLYCSTEPFSLEKWDKETRNGTIGRTGDIGRECLEISANRNSNHLYTFITCPRFNSELRNLGIKLPVISLIVRSVNDRPFSFQICILNNFGRRFRYFLSNTVKKLTVGSFRVEIPLKLDGEDWNELNFNIDDLHYEIFGTNYVETTRIEIYANCQIKEIYFRCLDPLIPRIRDLLYERKTVEEIAREAKEERERKILAARLERDKKREEDTKRMVIAVSRKLIQDGKLDMNGSEIFRTEEMNNNNAINSPPLSPVRSSKKKKEEEEEGGSIFDEKMKKKSLLKDLMSDALSKRIFTSRILTPERQLDSKKLTVEIVSLLANKPMRNEIYNEVKVEAKRIFSAQREIYYKDNKNCMESNNDNENEIIKCDLNKSQNIPSVLKAPSVDGSSSKLKSSVGVLSHTRISSLRSKRLMNKVSSYLFMPKKFSKCFEKNRQTSPVKNSKSFIEWKKPSLFKRYSNYSSSSSNGSGFPRDIVKRRRVKKKIQDGMKKKYMKKKMKKFIDVTVKDGQIFEVEIEKSEECEDENDNNGFEDGGVEKNKNDNQFNATTASTHKNKKLKNENDNDNNNNNNKKSQKYFLPYPPPPFSHSLPAQQSSKNKLEKLSKRRTEDFYEKIKRDITIRPKTYNERIKASVRNTFEKLFSSSKKTLDKKIEKVLSASLSKNKPLGLPSTSTNNNASLYDGAGDGDVEIEKEIKNTLLLPEKSFSKKKIICGIDNPEITRAKEKLRLISKELDKNEKLKNPPPPSSRKSLLNSKQKSTVKVIVEAEADEKGKQNKDQNLEISNQIQGAQDDEGNKNEDINLFFKNYEWSKVAEKLKKEILDEIKQKGITESKAKKNSKKAAAADGTIKNKSSKNNKNEMSLQNNNKNATLSLEKKQSKKKTTKKPDERGENIFANNKGKDFIRMNKEAVCAREKREAKKKSILTQIHSDDFNNNFPYNNSKRDHLNFFYPFLPSKNKSEYIDRHHQNEELLNCENVAKNQSEKLIRNFQKRVTIFRNDDYNNRGGDEKDNKEKVIENVKRNFGNRRFYNPQNIDQILKMRQNYELMEHDSPEISEFSSDIYEKEAASDFDDDIKIGKKPFTEKSIKALRKDSEVGENIEKLKAVEFEIQKLRARRVHYM